MFEGTFFSSVDPLLAAFTPELDARVITLLHTFADGSAAGRLRLVPNALPDPTPTQLRLRPRQGRHLRHTPDEITGRGVSCADGYRPSPGEPLALYFGAVVLDWPAGDFVLGLDSFRRDSRTLSPSVDAGPVCRVADPPILNAALLNHSCHDATVALRRPPELLSCALPCAVAYAKHDLPPGCRLLWDYDGGPRRGGCAFTVDHTRSVELGREGIATFPCACRSPAPCPRNRYFWTPP